MHRLKFDNRFLREFPDIATRVHTTHVKKPEMLIWSPEAGALLDLDPPKDQHGMEAKIFAGNQQLEEMQPYATRYGGHQFGQWAGQLGDGRAILLGEVLNPKLERTEIQLKGAGVTPYSRRGDGRAVLRSSLREFLCSEAMFHLGVPTTRALCCVLTGESVIRDMFYDGNPQPEPGAITTRLAPTFLRLGHWQMLAADKNVAGLRKLTDYTMSTYFPQMQGDQVAWWKEVCRLTAELMVHWQRVGFVHGVMNTDNLSILGLTIDYGPYGWMDIYDPDWTPNTTDVQNRRYRFGHQPAIALWNLQRMAEALALLTPEDTSWLRQGMEHYATKYNEGVLAMMRSKLGVHQECEMEFVTELDHAMRATEVDMTIFYRLLAKVRAGEGIDALKDAFYKWPLQNDVAIPFQEWIVKYHDLARKDPRSVAESVAEMNAMNPVVVPRNFLVQEVLDALVRGDRQPLDLLMTAIKTPYVENEITRPYFRKMPDWARNRAGCSALSCSS